MEFQIVRSNNPAQPYFWRIVASNGLTLGKLYRWLQVS